jgi:hypothetical protein
MTTWGKVHGSITWHAKALAAGDAALGVWVRLLGHCAQHLTDGFIAAPVAVAVGSSSPGAIDALVRAGLLEAVDGGYQLHDYLDHNSSRADIEASREASRERMAKTRASRKSQSTSGCTATAPATNGATTPATFGERSFAGEREIELEQEKETNTSSPTREVESNDVQPLALEEPKTGADAPASASAGGVVVELFKHWQRVHAHPQAKLDAKRRRAIERAVKSHGVDVVRAAIDGCAKSAFHKGQNERGAVYDDLTLILRDASKIESFAALAPKAEPKPRPVLRTVANDPFAVSPFPKSFYERKAAGQ